MRLTEFLRQVNKYDFLIERDVVNAGQIKKWVASISGRVQSDQAQKWFQSQLYQFLINRYASNKDVIQIQQAPPGSPDWLVQKLEAGGELFNVTPSTEVSELAMSVIDYINAWSEENPGREPRMRWEQAAVQATDWHKEMKNVSVSDEENEQDLAEIATIYEFKDGFKWVDLTTEACLKREGGRMGHCVGGYGAAVQAGTTKIFSLRNAKNLPHATIEATSEEPTVIASADDAQGDLFGDGNSMPPLKVEQVKGRSNKPPVAKYVPYVKEFLEWGNFEVGNGLGDIQNMGLYRKQGKYYTIDEVSKVVKKYKGGTKWVKLDDDVDFDYGGPPYHLMDKDGTIIATASTGAEDGHISGVSAPYGAKVDKEDLRPKIIDLLNQSNNIGDTGDLRNTWGIYHHDNKHGDLKDVATVMYDLPNGHKAVSASGNNYVVNSKHNVVFGYELGIDDSINIPKNEFKQENLEMNYSELANALSEASGLEIDTSYNSLGIPTGQDGKPLVPSGEPIYENEGISWYNGSAPSILPEGSDPDSIFIGYDRHKNPIYYIETGPSKQKGGMFAGETIPDIEATSAGFILGTTTIGGYGKTPDFKPGERILDIVISQEWGTADESFKAEMYEDMMWIQDTFGDWYKTDDSAPAEYQYNEYSDDKNDIEETDENSTLDTFWTETSLLDTGLEADFFIEMYAMFFDGKLISWDSRGEERDVEDPETGEYTTEYVDLEYTAKFTGNRNDYLHPLSDH